MNRWCVTICNWPDFSIVELGIDIEFLRAGGLTDKMFVTGLIRFGGDVR